MHYLVTSAKQYVSNCIAGCGGRQVDVWQPSDRVTARRLHRILDRPKAGRHGVQALTGAVLAFLPRRQPAFLRGRPRRFGAGLRPRSAGVSSKPRIRFLIFTSASSAAPPTNDITANRSCRGDAALLSWWDFRRTLMLHAALAALQRRTSPCFAPIPRTPQSVLR